MKKVVAAVVVLMFLAGPAWAAQLLNVKVWVGPANVSLSVGIGASGETARSAEPMILTGAQLPQWSRLAAIGKPATWPSGTTSGTIPGVGDDVRSAHLGDVVVPPDARAGVNAAQIAAYRWSNGGWNEIPVQVDQRFPYFLANGRSDFGIYSAVDEELTYAFDAETWKKTSGACFAGYPAGDNQPMADPVPTVDDDDEITFMASDAGQRVQTGVPGPKGTGATRQEISLRDGSGTSFVYLFLKPGGSSFNATNGYVRYARDENADEWIDRYSFASDDPEHLGTGNTGYGPNITGTVCRTAPEFEASHGANGTPRPSTDRFPRDGVTVTTPTYSWRATGRWQWRELHVAAPGRPGVYGPDLVDRWKGRAFSLSPERDDTYSIGGFEEEQTNWEANSALLGERAGPVRAIREVWGADSGTNTTMTELFYRDAVVYHGHLRVHPVPPTGVYSYWDYNKDVAARYYDPLRSNGVAIDGRNDDAGNIDTTAGQKPYADINDPTFNAPTTILNWEQVSGLGDSGSLVYINEIKGLTSVEHPAAEPFYRDDACLDDGTGSDPVVRPWPGESQADARLEAYSTLPCDQKQGAYGSSGVHFFFNSDSDNLFQSKPLTELDAQTWQFVVPTSSPHNVGDAYADNVRVPLVAVALQQKSVAAP